MLRYINSFSAVDITGSDLLTVMTLVGWAVIGVVPVKGRPRSNWGVESPLTAEPLLKKEGSILSLHLTSRHLLIIHASYGSNTAAAVWLDSNTLEPVQQLVLPVGVCYAWAEYGLQKMLMSTVLGDTYTISTQPQARFANPAYEQVYCVTLKAVICAPMQGFQACLSPTSKLQAFDLLYYITWRHIFQQSFRSCSV